MSGNSGPQQPKLFVHKRKKNQRSSGGQGQTVVPSPPAQPNLSPSKAPPSANGKTTSSRGASTSSSAPLAGTVQPLWYRYRAAIAAFFAINVAVFGYALFRSSSPEVVEEQQPLEKETVQMEDDNQVVVTDDRNEVAEPTLPETSIMELARTYVQVQPPVSDEHQQELFKWMLAELRKVTPVNTSDRANIDKQKEVLKQFIRRKESFTS